MQLIDCSACIYNSNHPVDTQSQMTESEVQISRKRKHSDPCDSDSVTEGMITILSPVFDSTGEEGSLHF